MKRAASPATGNGEGTCGGGGALVAPKEMAMVGKLVPLFWYLVLVLSVFRGTNPLDVV